MTNKPWFSVLKGIGIIALLTIVWLFFFAVIDTSGSETNYEPFNGASIICAVISYLIILFILQYNKVVHLKEEITTSYNAIEIKQLHVTKLLDQLQEVTDKIVDHELKMSVKNTFSELIEEEKQSDRLTAEGNDANHHQTKKKFTSNSGSNNFHDHLSQQSETVTKLGERIERDTKGRADESLRDLMQEIKEAEALVTNQRLYYNDTVSQYNKSIYALPFAFLRGTLGFKEQAYM
ncbi:TPA: LemA family protein [Streptococcus suis]|nr:LemA family protein [Streptococcus suis]